VLNLPPYVSIALFYSILTGGVVWLWGKLPREDKQAN
jgi:hypothetical protein